MIIIPMTVYELLSLILTVILIIITLLYSVPQLDVVALPKICNASSIFRQRLLHLMRNGSTTRRGDTKK